MARYIMLIDSETCMNCKACVVACQQRNHVPYGHARNWVRATPDASAAAGFKFQPGACMHCEDAPCVGACPTAATWRDDNGVVVIDSQRCIGCGACLDACPYGARFLHPAQHVADKCDYCGGGEPACVSVCPTQCRIFGDLDDPASPVAAALARRTLVRVTPENCDPKPTLAYLDKTTPQKLPPHEPPARPLAALGPLSQTFSWIGGITLILLGGVFGRQWLKSSEKEEAEMKTANTDSATPVRGAEGANPRVPARGASNVAGDAKNGRTNSANNGAAKEDRQ